MNNFLFGLLLLITVTFLAQSATSQALGKTYKCTTYYSQQLKGFACNDIPGLICQEGCNAFTTAENCILPDHPKKPATTELCTVGFGRDTAAAKACVTPQGNFRCTGKTYNQAVCHGCVQSDQIKWI